MAKSTANMVKSQSGKLYEPDSPQGIMIRSKGGTQAIEKDDDKKGIFASILGILQSNNSLLGQIDDNTEESEAAKRKRKLKEEDTDKPGMFGKVLGGVGTGLKGVGSQLNKINPFQEGGLGTKMSIAVLAGVLFAISKFSDKLVKPLADVLEMLDKEGGTLDKFKDTAFFKKAVEAFEKIKARAALITKDIENLLLAVSRVATVINDAFVKVDEYIASFDKDDEEGLSQTERADLFDDMKNRATKAITGFFGDVMLSIAGLLLGKTLIVETAKLAFKQIAPIFASRAAAAAFVGPMPAGAVAAGAVGIGTIASVAGLLLYGVTTTWSNISNSMADTIEEEGSVSFSGFFSKFFGGDNKGGVMNALRKAFEVGGTFALIGMGIGGALGFAAGGIGAIPGAIMGGLIGTGVGMIFGAIGGALGSDKIKSMMTGMGNMIADTVDAIGSFFGNVIAGFKSFFAGEGFMSGYNDARYADKSKAESDLIDIQDKIAALEEKKKAFKEKNPDLVFFDQRLIDKYQEQADDLQLTISDAPQHKLNRNRRLIEDRQIELDKEIKRLSGPYFKNNAIAEAKLKTFTEERKDNARALQAMPKHKDTLRTEMNNAEERLIKLEIEAKKAKIAEENKINEGGAATSMMQNFNKLQSNVSNFNHFNNIGVDDVYGTVRVVGTDGLQ